jgi:hypothetical protein
VAEFASPFEIFERGLDKVTKSTIGFDQARNRDGHFGCMHCFSGRRFKMSKMIKNFGGLIFSLLFNSMRLSAVGGTATSTLNFTTAAAELDTINTTTVNQSVNQFSTELIAQMAGGPVLFDQTFNVAYSDPTVQAAVAQAAGVLTGAGATSITGPTETSYSQSLVNSSSVTVTNSTTDNIIAQVTTWVGPSTVLVGNNFGVVQGYTLLPVSTGPGLIEAYPPVVVQGTDPISPPGNNAIIPTGGNPQTFTLLAGQTDINTLEFSFVDIDQTTTNTDTYLTTTVYDMVGSVVSVPEPSSLVLGLGGIAFALYRWRLAPAAGAARPKSTEKTY